MTVRTSQAWSQVLVVLVLQAASSASVFTAYSVIAVPLQSAFEPSRMLLMMGITMAALAAGCLGPPLGVAIDRFSMKRLMITGTALLGTGFLLLSYAGSMTHVLAIYLVPLAVGCVLTGPLAGSALLARWFTRQRGLAMGIAASGAAIGGLIVPPLLQFLIDSYEWRPALRMYGAALFVATAPLVSFLVVNRPPQRGSSADNYTPCAGHDPGVSETAGKNFQRPQPSVGRNISHVSTSEQESTAGVASLLRDRNFWLIALCLGMLLAGPMALISNLLPLLMTRNIDPVQGAVLLSVFSGANFLGKLTSGALADRIDYRILLAGILMLICLGIYGYLVSINYVALMQFSALLGFSQGAVVPLWSVILARNYGPEKMGRSMGLMGFIIMPFTLVSPPLFGWIYDHTGDYDQALIGYMVLLAFTLCVIALLRSDGQSTEVTSRETV